MTKKIKMIGKFLYFPDDGVNVNTKEVRVFLSVGNTKTEMHYRNLGSNVAEVNVPLSEIMSFLLGKSK